MVRILLFALALLLASTAHAHAGFVAAAVGAVASWIGGALAAGGLGAALIKGALTLALNVGVSLLQRALQKKPEEVQRGVQLEVEIGDDAPYGFVAGTFATAGTRKYSGSWGRVDQTPNAYLTDVLELGNLPAPGRLGMWVNGEKCTILWSEPATEQGYPVAEFRRNGKDHLWVRYNDGTQSEPDPFLRSKFGSHPDRPFKASMIGRGCPYAVVTALFNRDLFPGQMRWLFEPPVMKWYDLRKDSTVGGSGPHRWNDPSTWEPSDNPAIIIYNIIRGVYYDDGAGYREWIYGGQNLPSFRLPPSNWMAAANECDVLVDLAGGGQERQFRCGSEIRCDMEPLAVIQEMQKACSGRVVEVGGIFKMLVGAPGAAVYSFTDDDIIVTKGQSLRPFPSLGETHNGIEATYPEPAEMWATKDAPARYSAQLEAEDGNRRLVPGVSFGAVPFRVQVQRLMKAMLEEERRFRVHSFYLPPEAWLLDPNDVVSWTSARNGYQNKKFLIVRIDGEPGMHQLVLLKEIDPADYDWQSSDEQPTSTGYLGPIRAPAQPMVGWQVAPAEFRDGANKARRPSIEVFFSGLQEDVRDVRVQVRVAATKADWFDGDIPYGEPDPDRPIRSVILNALFLPNEEYEVRGIFLPYSGRLTEWSVWLPVTTPNVLLGPEDIYPVDIDHLNRDIKEVLNWLGGNDRTIWDEIERLNQLVADQNGQNFLDKQQLRREAVATAGNLSARFTEEITVAVSETRAVAQRVQILEAKIDDPTTGLQATATALSALRTEVNSDLEAISEALTQVAVQVGDVSADGRFRMEAFASPGEGWVRIGAQSVVTAGGVVVSQPAWFLDARSDGTSRMVVVANQFVVTDGTEDAMPLLFQDGALSLNVANIGTVRTGLVEPLNGKFRMVVADGRLEWFD